jgi:mRNA-degrading endonuclease HigB of HigAB toxin-antitoxin module
MRIITRKRLVDFWTLYQSAEGPMRAWEATVKGASWTHSNDVKRTFRNADWVNQLWVFDVSRNRVIADVRYQFTTANGAVIEGIVYLKHVLTHPEYDKWTASLYGKK